MRTGQADKTAFVREVHQGRGVIAPAMDVEGDACPRAGRFSSACYTFGLRNAAAVARRGDVVFAVIL